MDSCFSDELLQKLLDDQVPKKLEQQIVDHINECDLCQERVDALFDDADLREMRANQLQRQEQAQQDPIPAALLRRLHSLPVMFREGKSGDQSVRGEIGIRLWESGSNNPNFSDGTPSESDQDSHPFPTPRRIGQYELVREISSGGMGIVYEAFHTKLKRRVALKLLFPHRRLSKESVERFYREMEAVGQLDHSNIVRATDAGEHEGMPYLVMEYVEGCDLAQIVALKGQLSIADACEAVSQAACGLRHIHSAGMVHRDIKPSNLLLTQDGQVKVVDLGLARLHETETCGKELTASDHVMGTVSYMAPEQALNMKDVDHRADIYSLGCTLYHLLVGKPAYDKDAPLATLVAHRDEAVPSLREERPEIPPELDIIFQRMMAKRPEERFQTVDEMIAVLDEFSARLRENLGETPLLTDLFLDSSHIRHVSGIEIHETAVVAHAKTEPQTTDYDKAPKKLVASSRRIPTIKGRHRTGLILGAVGLLVVLTGFMFILQPSKGKLASNAVSHPERRAAEWVLEIGGTVEITVNGRLEIFDDVGSLPQMDFQLIGVNFRGNQQVTDKGLEKLTELSNLRTLSLYNTSVTNDGLSHIGKLKMLKRLDLFQTRINDAGLAFIKGLTQLEKLSIHNTLISDSGMANLAGMKELIALNLANTNVSDSGVKQLTGLTKLQWLHLANTNITDVGLEHLNPLTNLTELYISGTQATDNGVSVLKTSLPNCKITR